MPKPKVPPCSSNHVEYTRGKSKFCKLNTIEALIRTVRVGGGGDHHQVHEKNK